MLSAKLSVSPPYDDALMDLVGQLTESSDTTLKAFLGANIFLSIFMASIL